MIAKEIRTAILGLMGEMLDLLRISPLDDRQVEQIKVTLKNTVNRELVRLLETLEAQKVIRKCRCLEDLLATKDPKERRRLFEVRSTCRDCEGSGYIDVKKTASKVGRPSKKKSAGDAKSES